MGVPVWVWAATLAFIVGLLVYDLLFHVRKAHAPTLRESLTWSALYIGIAVLFGVVVLVFGGAAMGSEYFAGYVTEKALSVDNLFVFLIIMTSFRVPREDQQKVLLFGIVFSLVARTGFVFLGAALINTFAWVFYIFGLILLLTAGNLLRPDHDEEGVGDTPVIRIARRVLPATEHYDGDKLFTVQDGRRVLTPMLLVMVAIGGTDILFALDSIPAIFGLTQNVYIVFTATAFSLLGLRQLFFLIDDLLDRLIYLSYGLATILAFIGVKLILHALHENNLPFINGGEPVKVVEISTGFSLAVILGVLVVTVVASLLSPAGKAQTAIANARRHATSYLDMEYTHDQSERERVFHLLLAERDTIVALGPKYRKKVRDEPELMALLTRARESHEQAHGEHHVEPLLTRPERATTPGRSQVVEGPTTDGSGHGS
jgi:tellurite resistance protein TerC